MCLRCNQGPCKAAQTASPCCVFRCLSFCSALCTSPYLLSTRSTSPFLFSRFEGQSRSLIRISCQSTPCFRSLSATASSPWRSARSAPSRGSHTIRDARTFKRLKDGFCAALPCAWPSLARVALIYHSFSFSLASIPRFLFIMSNVASEAFLTLVQEAARLPSDQNRKFSVSCSGSQANTVFSSLCIFVSVFASQPILC